MGRRKRTLALVCAGLALAVSGCGDEGSGGAPPTLRPPADPKDQLEFGENTVRVGGISPADVAAAATMSVYPPGEAERPTSFFFARDDRWTDAVLAAQFATEPIDAALLAIDKEYMPTPTVDVMDRVTIDGYPKGKGLKAVIVGKAGDDVLLALRDRKLKATMIHQKSPAVLGEKLVPFHGGGAKRYSPSIVIASAEDRDYTLPAAAWSAYSGDTLVLVNRDEVPAAARRVVEIREKLTLERPHIYVIGPEKVISDEVVRDLSSYGEVQRVGAGSAIETAIELARFRDPDTLFGWGIDKGPANISLVNTKNWGNAIGAFTFAAAGPHAPLLLTDSSERLPGELADYLGELQGAKPNQGFVFGDRASIGSGVFDQLDRVLGAR